MTATLTEARDDIFDLIKETWDPTTYIMLWPDVAERIPTTPTPWARTTLNFTAAGQASLHNDQGVARFERIGFVVVQIFTPVGTGQGQSLVLGQTLLNGLEGAATPNGVWFTNVRYLPVGDSGDFYQSNVIADFSFDQVK